VRLIFFQILRLLLSLVHGTRYVCVYVEIAFHTIFIISHN
jgi:hypothetical protein